jgi:hypothetical protein
VYLLSWISFTVRLEVGPRRRFTGQEMAYRFGSSFCITCTGYKERLSSYLMSQMYTFTPTFSDA